MNTNESQSIAYSPAGQAWGSFFSYDTSALVVARYVGSGGTGCMDTAWTCETVDSTGDVGRESSIAVDGSGSPWVVYRDTTNSALKIARFVGSGGTGCQLSSWSCTTLQTGSSRNADITIDNGSTIWISYHYGASYDLRVARYVTSGGSGCSSTAWTCTAVDTSGYTGYATSIATDSSGNPWIAYRDDSNSYSVTIARYVGSGGSGCASTAWSCTAVNPHGYGASIRIDSTGTPWLSYRYSLNNELVLARFVTSGGTGCLSAAWQCTIVSSASSDTALALDAVGNPWVMYRGGSPASLRFARYVGSGGSGCVSSAWTCNAIRATYGVESTSSLAFDANGRASFMFYDYDTGNAGLALFNRGNEIAIIPSAYSNTGDALTESHADMTSTSDTANRDDADCIGGGAWNNGMFSEDDELPGFSLPDGTVTPQCTELAFSIDTSGVTAGTTYRFMIATKDALRPDKSSWRAPSTFSAYATLTIAGVGDATTTAAVIVEPVLSFVVSPTSGSCNGVSQSSGTSVSPTVVSLGRPTIAANQIAAQDLTVEANSDSGFTVFIRSSGALGVIDDVSGTNGSPVVFPAAGTEAFGYTTSDSSLSGTATRFTNGGAKWAALTTTNAPVSFSSTPVATDTVCVAYQVGISSATFAGTYSTTVTYSAVPTF